MIPSKRTRTMLAAVAITLAFVAAGCGSSGGSDSSGTTSADGATTTAASGSQLPVPLEGTVNDKGTKDVSADGADAEVEMELDDNYFSPTFIKAAPGAKVTIELENEGDNPHTFTTDDGAVDQEVAPGKKATVEVTVPESGSLRFSCNFHGSMGMQGALYSGSGASAGGDTTTTKASSGGGSGY